MLMRLSKKMLVGEVKLKNQLKAGCFNYLSLGYSTRLLKASLDVRQKTSNFAPRCYFKFEFWTQATLGRLTDDSTALK